MFSPHAIQWQNHYGDFLWFPVSHVQWHHDLEAANIPSSMTSSENGWCSPESCDHTDDGPKFLNVAFGNWQKVCGLSWEFLHHTEFGRETPVAFCSFPSGDPSWWPFCWGGLDKTDRSAQIIGDVLQSPLWFRYRKNSHLRFLSVYLDVLSWSGSQKYWCLWLTIGQVFLAPWLLWLLRNSPFLIAFVSFGSSFTHS